MRRTVIASCFVPRPLESEEDDGYAENAGKALRQHQEGMIRAKPITNPSASTTPGLRGLREPAFGGLLYPGLVESLTAGFCLGLLAGQAFDNGWNVTGSYPK